MKTFTQFQNQLNELLGNIPLSERCYSPVYHFMGALKKCYIETCIQNANIYHVTYPSIDLSKINCLDDMDEIKVKINEHFQDRGAWKAKRLLEICPSVDVIGILNTENKKQYWFSDIAQHYTPETAHAALEEALLKKFRIKCSDDLRESYLLARAIKELSEFVKLTLDYDLILLDQNNALIENSAIQIKIFKHGYHFKFTDQKMQKKFVSAYLEAVPTSRFFRD